jgi:hypothetical protein
MERQSCRVTASRDKPSLALAVMSRSVDPCCVESGLVTAVVLRLAMQRFVELGQSSRVVSSRAQARLAKAVKSS